MKQSELKLVQSELKSKGYYSGGVDGLSGPKTRAAVHQFLSDNTGQLSAERWTEWNNARKRVAALQLLALQNQLDVGPVDGLHGPQTESAATLLQQLLTQGAIARQFSDIIPVRENPHQFPLENEAELNAFYGQPGSIELVRVECPWLLRLDWDLSTTTRVIAIHEKLSESLEKVLSEVYEHYGDAGIQQHGLNRYGGSYNHRKKRGSATAWSTHAWGIAIDWFPSQNKLSWRSNRASLADPALDFWWQSWEREGWLSLGRSEDRDWMHVQAAKR
ncbi:MAG: M15 family peptidase [Gammaproteobacteria bacterium]|nr:M15 family peptidase [Gammaproteobacteria bacterium]